MLLFFHSLMTECDNAEFLVLARHNVTKIGPANFLYGMEYTLVYKKVCLGLKIERHDKKYSESLIKKPLYFLPNISIF